MNLPYIIHAKKTLGLPTLLIPILLVPSILERGLMVNEVYFSFFGFLFISIILALIPVGLSIEMNDEYLLTKFFTFTTCKIQLGHIQSISLNHTVKGGLGLGEALYVQYGQFSYITLSKYLYGDLHIQFLYERLVSEVLRNKN
jgi:hypothetical protein